MQKIREFLQGKKTYIGAAALALVAILGWWYGVVNATVASGMLAAAFSVAGLGAKSQRTADAVLTVLAEVRDAQAKAAAGQKVDPKALALDVAKHLFAEATSVRGAPLSGAVFGNVAASGPPLTTSAQTCIYCGLPATANNTVCLDPRNTSAPDSVGNRHHGWIVVQSGIIAK